MNRTIALLFLLLVLLISGCIELQQDYFINADGSGKVVSQLRIPASEALSLIDDTNELPFSEQIAKIIQSRLSMAGGIDVRSNIFYGLSDDEEFFYYNAATYFENLNDIFFPLNGANNSLKYSFAVRSNDQIEILLQVPPSQTAGDLPSAAAQELTEAMIRARIEYAQNRLKMTDHFASLKIYQVLHLPGDIKEFSNFKKFAPRTAELYIQGDKILTAIDSLMADDDWLGQKIQTAGTPFVFHWDEAMNEKMFGQKAPIRLLLSSKTEDLFDYDFETAAAVNNSAVVDSNFVSSVDSQIVSARQNYYPLPQGKADYETPPNVQIREAMKTELLGDFQTAIQLYQNVIANEKTGDKYLAAAHYQLGMCLFDNGFVAQAVEQFNYVIDNFSLQRNPALKASRQLQRIAGGKAIPKIVKDKPAPLPCVTATTPVLFAENINPDTDKIIITFDTPMQNTYWCYSSFEPCLFPEKGDGSAGFDGSGRIWTLPVKLQGGKIYAIAINGSDELSRGKQNFAMAFKSKNGITARSFVLVFTTAAETGAQTFIDDELRQKCEKFNNSN